MICICVCMIVDFFKTALKLKNIQRQGWVDKLSIQNAESVADHTYCMAVMGMIISDLEGIDTTKTLKMILIHDLAESGIGDITPGTMEPKEKRRLESIEFEKIIHTLPENLASEYRNIWHDYLDATSAESNMVHQLDKLEMALQSSEYLKQGYPKDALEPFFSTAHSQITNPLLKELLAGIEGRCQKTKTN